MLIIKKRRYITYITVDGVCKNNCIPMYLKINIIALYKNVLLFYHSFPKAKCIFFRVAPRLCHYSTQSEI